MSIGAAQAYEIPLTYFNTNLPPIDVHGFASQGFLDSSKYNYLGDTTRGSFRFTEAGLNASINPFDRTRITAQAFTYDVGRAGQYDVVLDYASLEYTFNDYIGVRAGRVRRPQGLYNDIQDVDLARTYVLLPQGIYDPRWRDFYVGLDGGEFFGTIPLQKAGSVGYDIYAGMINPSVDGGLALAIRDGLPSIATLNSLDSDPTIGGQFWYNTPINGLRFGASEFFVYPFNYESTVSIPFGPTFNPDNRQDIIVQQYSAEYAWQDWTFQAEYFNQARTPRTPGPGNLAFTTDSWYVGAAYRFNKWVEAGTYYNEYYSDVNNRGNSQKFQKDLALSLRFDLRDWWIVKVEGHYIHGTGLLSDSTSNPIASQNDGAWFMLAVKTTVSF